MDYSEKFESIRKSVVKVVTKKGKTYSGFVIGSGNKIITNVKALEGDEIVKVVFNSEKGIWPIERGCNFHQDPKYQYVINSAVISIPEFYPPLNKFCPLSEVYVGQEVFFAGFSESDNHDVYGIPSNIISKVKCGVSRYLIRIDRCIPVSFSGGPLFNLKGELLGILGSIQLNNNIARHFETDNDIDLVKFRQEPGYVFPIEYLECNKL